MLDKALLISQLPVADEQTKDPCDKSKDKLSVRVYGQNSSLTPGLKFKFERSPILWVVNKCRGPLSKTPTTA